MSIQPMRTRPPFLRHLDEVNRRTVEKRKLEEMQNHQQRKEGIEMDVKAVAPLHVLTTRRLHNQVSVRHQPSHSHSKYDN